MLHADLGHRLRAIELDVRIDVAPGRTLALAGPSGAGKTTVLRAIAGLLRTDRGSVRCGPELWMDAASRTWVAPEERGCGVVFQDYALFPHLSAWRNVAYGLRGRDRRPRAVAALRRFQVEELADAHPRELSGGERQRVALARALAPGPRVLLLDEPLAALDARTRASATGELAEVLRTSEIPAIVVTHEFTEACALAEEIAVMRAGRIAQRGSATELVESPTDGFVAELTGASVLRGVARGASGRALTLVTLEGGGQLGGRDEIAGPVLAVVRPWDVSLAPPDAPALNRLAATVSALTPLGGGRMRITLALPAPLVAEVDDATCAGLRLQRGAAVTAVLDPGRTRLVAVDAHAPVPCG